MTDKERLKELEEANKKNYWIASDFKFENLKLEQQNKELREALEFYADSKNYEEVDQYMRLINVDSGHRARKALGNTKTK